MRLERLKLPTDRNCAKPKGERSIWQSTKISALRNRTAKVTGADHVAHYRARRYLGDLRCLGRIVVLAIIGRRDLSSRNNGDRHERQAIEISYRKMFWLVFDFPSNVLS